MASLAIERPKAGTEAIPGEGFASNANGNRSLNGRIHPIFGSFHLNHKGYPRINGGPHRKKFLHRAVWELIAGRPIPEGFTVHHMNGKLCWCPHQLVALGPHLHQHADRLRDPYTGEFMRREQWLRRYGE